MKNELKMKSYINDVLESISYLHKEGVVHCDLKLENILIHKYDEEDCLPIVKVCDFGIAHRLNPSSGKLFMEYKSGSHSYIAPEVKNVTTSSPVATVLTQTLL